MALVQDTEVDLWKTIADDRCQVPGHCLGNITQIVSCEINNGFRNIIILNFTMARRFVKFFQHLSDSLFNESQRVAITLQ